METVLLHKSAFLYVTSIFRLSSFVFANALLTGITKTFVPFYSSFPEIYSNIANERMYEPVKSVFDTISTDKIKKENSIITSNSDLQYVIPDPDTRKFVQTILRRETSVDEIRKRLHVPILLLHECDKTQKATELSETYLEEIKRYHLDRAVNYFNIQNGKQKKQNVHGYDNIQFHLILFPVPNKNEIVNWFVERAKQINEDA